MGNRLQQLLPENIAQALCRTLIHSLWQGLVLAMLTGLVMMFTKKSSAAKRYRLLAGLLCLFTISFIVTLIIALNAPAAGSFVVATNSGVSMNLWELLNYNLIYIQQHSDVIIFTWLLIICLRSFKMMFGLYALERLKRTKVNPAGLQWEQRVSRLSQTMGIKRAVSLLESAVVKVPVIIGYLKPLILVPVGLVNALGQQEVEAILLHELAHIRRRDYLVNLLQSFIETLFFFNPGVLWLSSLIRAERENCCDDIAVSQTRNKVRYISALVHFEEYRLNTPAYALALTGKNGGMLQRLERMAANRNRSLNKLEAAGLALLLLVSSLVIAAKPGSRAELIPKANKTAPAPLSAQLRKYIHDRELAARKIFLEQKMAEGTANKAEALEFFGYKLLKEPATATQTKGIQISPELRRYFQERERATGRRLRAEEAAMARKRSKDSIP
jgi:bla regulator protein BlaR1